MSKRLLAIFISLVILSMSCFVVADSGYGDNNTGADNTITDTISWLASDTYTIEDGFVTGVNAGTEVSVFKSNFVNSNQIILDTSSVKTGSKVWYGSSGEVHTVIVSGDVDGNGSVNASDIIYLSDHIVGTKMITDNVKFKAADINSSNSITVVDLVNVRKVILGK